MAHADSINLSQQVLTTINAAGGLSFLTDTNVAAADTKAGLKAAIDAVKVHNDLEPIKIQLKRALDFDSNITDANILSLTTVAGLAALITQSNSGREILI